MVTERAAAHVDHDARQLTARVGDDRYEQRRAHGAEYDWRTVRFERCRRS
jgi:hypothetical protein